MRRFLLSLLILAAFGQTLHAQIQVGLTLKRRYYMMYEPIIAEVSITNRAGRDLPLGDADSQHWFGFEILTDEGRPVPPIDPNYELGTIMIPAGGTITRSVNLNSLYPVQNAGLYRLRATIYFAPSQKFFQSSVSNIEVSEGKVMWQQVVGVPDGEKGARGMRKFSLLTFRQTDFNILYARVEDANSGTVYCCSAIGRLVSVDPEVQLDVLNQLHVLQIVGPKMYLYSRIGLNGEIIRRATYLSTKTRPKLRRDKVGEVAVLGGMLQNDIDPSGAPPAPEKNVPKVSDRPAGLPAE